METEYNGMLPFLGIQLLNRSHQIETRVYVKLKNSSPLLHYQSHVENRYKQGLLRTMLDRAYRLSSCWSHFTDECNWLKTAFSRLKYPKHLVNSTIKSFVDSKVCDQQRPLSQAKETDDTVRVGFTIYRPNLSRYCERTTQGSEPKSKHHHPSCVCQPKNWTRTECERSEAIDRKWTVCSL